MLAVKQIEAAKPKDRPYRLLDSNGLYLYVPISGKEVWQMRYKIGGKEKGRRCGEVFRYAIITGRAKYNPAPDLADAMKGYRKKNYPFLPADQILAFNRALSSFSGSI